MPVLRMRPARPAGQAPRQEPPETGRESAAPPGPKEVAYQRKVAAARAVGYRGNFTDAAERRRAALAA